MTQNNSGEKNSNCKIGAQKTREDILQITTMKKKRGDGAKK